jgi:hypothetical protein
LFSRSVRLVILHLTLTARLLLVATLDHLCNASLTQRRAKVNELFTEKTFSYYPPRASDLYITIALRRARPPHRRMRYLLLR